MQNIEAEGPDLFNNIREAVANGLGKRRTENGIEITAVEFYMGKPYKALVFDNGTIEISEVKKSPVD